jgi:UDP-glucose 4-epimerase
MKVVITGGAGYVGAELAAALAADPAVSELIVYDNLSRGHHGLFIGPAIGPGRVSFVQGDVLDSRQLRKVINRADVVYHLAARVTTPFADAGHHQFEQVNHWGTAEVVYAIEDHAPNARVVYLSSAAVYGQGEGSAALGRRPSPRTGYGSAKLRGEEHMGRLMDRQPVFILRSGNVHGPGRSVRFDAVINRFLFEAHLHGRITVQGSGHQRRPFVHISALVHSLNVLRNAPLQPGTYDIVEQGHSVLEIVEALRELYPGLELLLVDQHLDLASLEVPRDLRTAGVMPLRPASLVDDLEAFRSHFAF